jgi:dTDP-4-amino-4,6-dideoxygalactose transaminase
MIEYLKIPFSPPYTDELVEREVLDSLRSGWITTGPKVKALEVETAKLCGAQEALCCNSATSAMMLVLHWFGVTRGDEVIIPAYTYAATALSVMHIGAKPVMVDIGEDFNISPEKIKAAITPKTKAIIPVDIGGWPCDYESIMAIVTDCEIAKMFNPKGRVQEKLGRILIMADSAHSVGAQYRGKSAALWSDMTVFSYHAVKNVTTAEGGAIVINMPEPFEHSVIYKTLRLWSLNGQTKDAFTKSQAGGWRYDIVYPGFKMNMPDVLAAIGLAQLRQYQDHLLVERRRVFQTYNRLLSKSDYFLLPRFESEQKSSSCHLYTLRIKDINESQRDAIIQFLTDAGISVNVHFIPLPMLSVFRESGYDIADYPVAYRMYANEISLPIYPQLTEKQINYICEHLIKALNQLDTLT